MLTRPFAHGLAIGIALTAWLTLADTAEAQKEDILRLPEAENQIFTPEGRHFVSSGIGLFELVEGPRGIIRLPAGMEECGVNGLGLLETQPGSLWLVAACNRDDGTFLYAGRVGSNFVIRELFEIPGFFIANGVEISPAGAVLVADFNVFAPASIARVEVEEIAGELTVVGFQADFLSTPEGIASPNGLARRGGDLFVTDSPRVLKVSLGPNDEYLGTETVYTLTTTFDDLAILCSGIAVTDFINGTLILIDATGNEFTSPDLFQMPSSVEFGRPPLYQPNELIVTERGFPGDDQSNIGNRVSKVTVPPGAISTFCSPPAS